MNIEFKEFPKMARLSREIIITEKIDGTNASIYIDENGEFLTGSRNRWITPQDDNFGFSKWANENKDNLLKLGIGHHFGEWWGSGIQRGYNLLKGEKRFSLFNVNRWNEKTKPECCYIVPVLYAGEFNTNRVEESLETLKNIGSIANKGFMNPEGIVIFHTGANLCFKKTCKNDEIPKSLLKENEFKG